MIYYRYKVLESLEGVILVKKLVFDLKFVFKVFGGIENMPILQNKSYSYSVRDLSWKPNSIIEFYDRNHNFVGQAANSIGPYGNSDFWDIEDECIYSTDTPDVDFDVFCDRLYNVIVVRA